MSATAPRWRPDAATFAAIAFALVVALQPIGRTAELPLLVAAILGIVLAWRHRATLRDDGGVLLVVALFGAYWLPALLSAPEAVEPRKTWSTVATALRLLPFALCAVLAFRGRDAARRSVHDVAAALALLWALDALVQAATGTSLGGQLQVDRLSGVFGDDNLKLGPALAVLAPFALVAALERFGWRAAAVVWLVLALAILLAGARAGWVAYAVATVALLWRRAGSSRERLRWLGACALAAFALAAAAYATSDRFAARIERTLAVARGDVAAIDFALAKRVPIFTTATRMAIAHPFNGVGARGFRYDYPEHAAAGDPWIDPATRTGALHAHQIVLEVASETGLAGLALWLAGALLAWRSWRAADEAARARAESPALALLAMTFPLNTHFAFYSAFWGLLFWWLLALYVAALSQQPEAR